MNATVDTSTDEWRDLVKRQTHLEKELAQVGASQENLTRELGAVRYDLRAVMQKLNEPAPATNWVGIGSLILTSMAVVGALFVFALNPVKGEVTRLQGIRDAQITPERQETAQIARLDERTLWLTELVLRGLDIDIEEGYIEGTLESLTDQVESIDRLGSRKWNRPNVSDD